MTILTSFRGDKIVVLKKIFDEKTKKIGAKFCSLEKYFHLCVVISKQEILTD